MTQFADKITIVKFIKHQDFVSGRTETTFAFS